MRNYEKEIKKALPKFTVQQMNPTHYKAVSADSNFSYLFDVKNCVVIAHLTENFRLTCDWLVSGVEIFKKLLGASNEGIYGKALRMITEKEKVFWGKSHCHEDDTFNIEEGVRIARQRALEKYYKERFARLSVIENLLMSSVNKVSSEKDYIGTKVSQYSKNR